MEKEKQLYVNFIFFEYTKIVIILFYQRLFII